MSWLDVDAWIDACGPRAAGLRTPVEVPGLDALAAAIAAGPRRVVALIGEPGAGTSRTAVELARRAGLARYRDPIAAPSADDVGALAALLAGLPDDAAPMVILDGPDRREALAALPALVSRPLHPGLRVVVPCDPDTAPDLPRLGGLRRGSILVAVVDRPGAAPAPVPAIAGLLPLVLAGRVPRGACDDEPAWIAAGVAAHDPGGDTVVCLIEDRARRAIADGADVGAVIARWPALRPAIADRILTWTRGEPPAGLLDALTALDAGALPDPFDLLRRGIRLHPGVIAALEARIATLAGVADDETRAILAVRRAELGFLRRDRRAAVEALTEVLAAAAVPSRRARAAIALASIARERPFADRALDEARRAADPVIVAEALTLRADLCRDAHDREGERAGLEEAAVLLEAAGDLAAATQRRASAASAAAEVRQLDEAVALGERVRADRRRLGDPQGELFALYQLARWAIDRTRRDEAGALVAAAQQLASSIGDLRGLGYTGWFLGALAEQRGDGVEAMTHYQESIDAYAQIGDVPERVTQSLASLRTAHTSRPVELRPEPPMPTDDLEGPLVPLRRGR